MEGKGLENPLPSIFFNTYNKNLRGNIEKQSDKTGIAHKKSPLLRTFFF
jgi:hypothetical protein